tara:strand:- start:1575 stop:1964 length:390 start_codon:yes stop_codon:yes gene_type:complete
MTIFNPIKRLSNNSAYLEGSIVTKPKIDDRMVIFTMTVTTYVSKKDGTDYPTQEKFRVSLFGTKFADYFKSRRYVGGGTKVRVEGYIQSSRSNRNQVTIMGREVEIITDLQLLHKSQAEIRNSFDRRQQ